MSSVLPERNESTSSSRRVVFLARVTSPEHGAQHLPMCVHQAGPLAARDHAADVFFALPDRIMVANERQPVSQKQAGKERAEIFRAVVFDAPHDIQPRKILLEVTRMYGKCLSSFSRMLYLGGNSLMRLDSSEKPRLVGNADVFEVRDLAHHGDDLRRMVFGGLKVLPDAVFQRDRLADVDDFAAALNIL